LSRGESRGRENLLVALAEEFVPDGLAHELLLLLMDRSGGATHALRNDEGSIASAGAPAFLSPERA
jgi:hypothetical protein